MFRPSALFIFSLLLWGCFLVPVQAGAATLDGASMEMAGKADGILFVQDDSNWRQYKPNPTQKPLKKREYDPVERERIKYDRVLTEDEYSEGEGKLSLEERKKFMERANRLPPEKRKKYMERLGIAFGEEEFEKPLEEKELLPGEAVNVAPTRKDESHKANQFWRD